MPVLVQLESGDGSAVLFEGQFSEAELQEIAIGDRIEDVVKATTTSLQSLGATVRRCASDLLAAFDDVSTQERPGRQLSQAVIEMGVSVSGEGNVIVARGAAEANLKVTLTWNFA